MNRNGRWNPLTYWRRLTLWPRLAIGVTIGFGVLFAGFSVLGIRAVDASTNRILHERLAITKELAEDFEGLLDHRFSDLRAFDPRPSSPAVERRLLGEIFRASGGAFTGVGRVDQRGAVTESQGAGWTAPARAFVQRVVASGKRQVSRPFRDALGKPVVALGMPVRGLGGGAMVGLLDLSGRDVTQRLAAARELGTTGHAELVGPGGIALASTEPGAALHPGEHLAFYREMFARHQAGIANVRVTPSAREPDTLRGQGHEMAFVPLAVAPWAVALGGTDSETYAPARHLRYTLMLAGGGALAALWLLTLFGARLLVRPVRGLTRSAEQMASGNLGEKVSVTEGGEIGVLAESLETMRVQLKDSLETVRRWGEELELKVADRTGELNARNRQLAAVSAILSAANESHDLEGMLARCLEVVLEQTRADAAAISLPAEGDGTTETVERGSWPEFPDSAPAAELDARPLHGPSGVVGTLTLGRRGGLGLPSEDEPILAAICDQIGVAVENTRLAGELRRLEALHEVQRMRTELISAVSHELRTPLGFIKSYATTLLREDAPIDADMRRHFLEIIDEETDKLEHMIDELLDASRLQAGRLPIEARPIALDELLTHSVDKARASLEGAGHAVALRLPADAVRVLADPLRIEQVLDNLLENAARYSHPGSDVDVGLSAEDGHALLSVTDRGDTVSAVELERIFEPFYRGRNAQQRGIRGAGLGLAICRGIVEAHGGEIWGESGPDDTTTFMVSLPLAGANGGPDPPPQ